MKHTTWQLQDAKSKFSQLVESAMADEPQIVTKHGHNAVVVLSYKEYEAMTKPKISLVNFFRDSPLAGVELDISRNNDFPREIEL
ncbi:MAG: type II toxin-antitoxin system Phd/YefM family antitoxin [gamma proteobacterium symbiont of Bathyaustriella thionipta]|nr:type II toxin-antitoxin system Phd/YefM family antitoxin [gamma proteobacterium symbiont of Bathyaustriella thionipta]MCU7950735.1 type II toxin-antitoxin system Phd/YefM family antitoxin [gamma proteobacterium symbiont of Bathyaustriella thionipta]MCU7953525.1 type II toxin-antitoxin system Phd/YefM family antitoxin [gamma proteobacterium symbiont of Bathyaustriella thionipta]MCU7957372.1 type II toxin-antitoxin system Phd/YefM family antitoxin [gamma proteobacterium symbiont of Bathyaustrie